MDSWTIRNRLWENPSSRVMPSAECMNINLIKSLMIYTISWTSTTANRTLFRSRMRLGDQTRLIVLEFKTSTLFLAAHSLRLPLGRYRSSYARTWRLTRCCRKKGTWWHGRPRTALWHRLRSLLIRLQSIRSTWSRGQTTEFKCHTYGSPEAST